MLGIRNQEAMGISDEMVGSIWNSNKVGNIYKDGFFYTAKDFGWLKNIPEGNEVKSLVSGVGMKVVENTGGAIGFKTKPSQWKDATACENWTEDGGKKKCKANKKITVERVAYHESNGKKYELGKEVCMLKVKDNNNSRSDDIYLLVGLAEVKKKGIRSNGHDWEWKGKDWLKNLSGCDLLKKAGWNQLKLKVEKHGLSGDKGVSSNQWIVVLGSTEGGIVDFNNGRNGKSIVGVVLGLVDNWAVNARGWDGIKELTSEWTNDFVQIKEGKNVLNEEEKRIIEEKQNTINNNWKVNNNWDALNEQGVVDLRKIREKGKWIIEMGEWKGESAINYEWWIRK